MNFNSDAIYEPLYCISILLCYFIGYVKNIVNTNVFTFIKEGTVADNGIIIIGDQTIGYSERDTYIYWDVSSDMSSDRSCAIAVPYYQLINSRYVATEHIQHIYATRWVHIEYTPEPISERYIFMHYAACMHSERTVYYYPDTRERLMFVEGLLTATPLLMKYPKYYNWNYVPQILNPQFTIWSHYDLEETDVTLKIISSGGATIYLNSGTSPDAFSIEKTNDTTYVITVAVDHVFEPTETVTCYLTAYDVKDNYLKPGMW